MQAQTPAIGTDGTASKQVQGFIIEFGKIYSEEASPTNSKGKQTPIDSYKMCRKCDFEHKEQ